MSKHNLLQLVCLLFLFSGGSLAVAQELDLDEIDVFGDSEEPATPTPETPTDDVFGEGGAPSDDPLTKDPNQFTDDDLVALMEKAAAASEQGEFDQAIAIYSRIMQNARFSRYAPVLFERAKAFKEVGELQLADAGFDEAAANAQLFPDLLIAALSERGKLLMDMGNYEDALNLFSQAVSSSASDPELLYLRGKAQLRVAQSGFGASGDTVSQAISSLKRAIALREGYADAYAERASANLAILELDKAIDDYTQALAYQEEEYPSWHARLGSTYQQRADQERARRKPNQQEVISDYRAAIDSYTNYLDVEEGKTEEDYDDTDLETVQPDAVFVSRAVAQISLANELPESDRKLLYEQAIDDCNRALEFREDGAGALFQRALAERLLGRFDDAIESYTQLTEVSLQSEPEAALRRGIISYYQGDQQSARKDFEYAMEFIVDGRASFWAGATYASEGDYAEAERLYTRALRENPGYLPAYNNRGLVNMRLGYFAQAFNDFDTLVRRDPRDQQARERREQAREMMRRSQPDPYTGIYDNAPGY